MRQSIFSRCLALRPALLLAPLLLSLGACVGPAPKSMPGLNAKRCEISVAESVLDLAHGGKHWVTELYLEDLGLSCNLAWGMSANKPLLSPMVPRLRLFRAEKTRYSTPGWDNKPSVRGTETVRLPETLVADMQQVLTLRESITKRLLELDLLPDKSRMLSR